MPTEMPVDSNDIGYVVLRTPERRLYDEFKKYEDMEIPHPSVKEISEEFNISMNSISKTIAILVKKGVLKRVGWGRYKISFKGVVFDRRTHGHTGGKVKRNFYDENALTPLQREFLDRWIAFENLHGTPPSAGFISKEYGFARERANKLISILLTKGFLETRAAPKSMSDRDRKVLQHLIERDKATGTPIKLSYKAPIEELSHAAIHYCMMNLNRLGFLIKKDGKFHLNKLKIEKEECQT
jgi:SOS-response transcriptional repressor LexA